MRIRISLLLLIPSIIITLIFIGYGLILEDSNEQNIINNNIYIVKIIYIINLTS